MTAGGSGASGEGSGGSQATVEQLTAERDRIEAERRALQSERDRLRADNERLTAGATTPTPTQDEPLTREAMLALLRREREMGAAVPALREQFTMADPALFDRADDYDSVEAFRAAVERSHTSFQSRMEAQGLVPKSELDTLRQRYAEKYGPLEETPPDTSGGNAGGLPTFEQLAQYTFPQLDAFIAEHGEETYQRILRSAQEG